MAVSIKRITALLALTIVALALVPPQREAVAQSSDLNYSIKEARAYATKASLDKAVIEAAPKCNPDDDPKYKCDEGQWNHQPNCPEKIEIGPEGKAPEPKPVGEIEPARGGAGDNAGGESAPPQSSPVRYNRFVALGTLSRITGLKEARGFASRVYVDLSGRDDPEAHTESEAKGTQRPWEERCFPDDAAKEGDNYTHLLSRSETEQSTYHMTQCHKMQCFEGAPGPGTFGGDAEKATAIVDLSEEGGEVVGKLSAVVEDLKYGGGQLTVESVETFLEFRSDGTAQGLRWSVTSTANGVKLGGQPITLPPGQMVSGPGFSVGMAAPYVKAEDDGTKLTIVAEGLTIGTEQQAVFVGGAEVYASFGDGTAGLSLPPIDDIEPIDTTGGGIGGGGGDFDSPVGGIGSVGGTGDFGFAAPDSGTAAPPSAAGAPGEVLVYEMATGRGALPSLLLLGGLMWFFMMSRWLQRFAWGRKLNRLQPFRTIDWVYRAFVKS